MVTRKEVKNEDANSSLETEAVYKAIAPITVVVEQPSVDFKPDLVVTKIETFPFWNGLRWVIVLVQNVGNFRANNKFILALFI